MAGLPDNISSLASFGATGPFGTEGSAFHQLVSTVVLQLSLKIYISLLNRALESGDHFDSIILEESYFFYSFKLFSHASGHCELITKNLGEKLSFERNMAILEVFYKLLNYIFL